MKTNYVDKNKNRSLIYNLSISAEWSKSLKSDIKSSFL